MMLRLSESLVPLIIQRLVIVQIMGGKPSRNDMIHSLRLRLEVASARAVVDSFIVGGISFFASLIALGHADILINFKISCFSSFTMAGLTFFNELKIHMKQK